MARVITVVTKQSTSIPYAEWKSIPSKGYGKMYQGALYRFCSKSCLDKFDTDPQRYLTSEGGAK
jgi:YHS domain-containing protein